MNVTSLPSILPPYQRISMLPDGFRHTPVAILTGLARGAGLSRLSAASLLASAALPRCELPQKRAWAR